MLIRLSRALFWLAACAAGLALLGPAQHGAWLTGAAGISLVGAYALWRLAVWRQGQEDGTAEAVLPAQALPDEAALLEVAALVTHAATAADGVSEALAAVARTLRSELGAHHVAAHLVRDVDAVHASVAPLMEAQTGGVGSERRIRLDATLLGEAVRSGRLAGTHPGPLALPVARDGRVIGVLELGEIALAVGPAALAGLLELARLQLVESARRASAAAAPALPAQLVELLPASVFVSDAADGCILGASAHVQAEFGFERAAVIGRTPRQAFGHAAAELLAPALREALESHAPVEQEFEIPGSAGTRTVHLRHRALRHADGTPQAVVTLARDVSADRHTRRELNESQARSREFAETVDDSLFVSNPQRSHFEFLAGSAFETWGMTREQFASCPASFLDNVIEEDRPILAERMERELRGESADITFRIRHPTKGLRWLRSRTRTRAMPDGTLRVNGMVADVTEARQREQELERARDEAQAASEAKSQFMANMSHEIRTPMNGILGMTELLLGTALNDKQRRFAQAVYRSGEALLEIINDILDFSKMEAGRLELAPTDFVLRGVVEDTLELLAPRAHERGLGLSFREESGLPAVVHGDPLRLRQVLTNLVANAIKFTEHGEVVVDVRRAPDATSAGEPAGPTGRAPQEPPRGAFAAVGAGAEGDRGASMTLEVNVRDTGIGIAADVLPRLFNAFTQANGGMSRRHGGTGLGLSISRHLVELMGGAIDVRSAPGIGSEFRFTVALQAARGGSGAPDVDAGDLLVLPGVTSARVEGCGAPVRLNRHVLVVEDNRVNQEVIGQMLRRLGCEVRVAAGATEGLQALCEKSFDLVLMDIQMPGMDGIEALHWFRRGGNGRYGFVTSTSTRVVAVTANALGGDEQRFLDLGFDDYLSKPFRQSQLRAMLTRNLMLCAPMALDEAPEPGMARTAPAAPAPVSAVLDEQALARLRELDPRGANHLLERVLKAFETSVARLLPQLQEAHRLGDLAGIRHVAHTLKSSSASIGAIKLSQQCADIETMIRLEKIEDLDARVDAMCAEVGIVLQALRSLMDVKS